MRRFVQSQRFWALLAIVGGALVGFAGMFERLRGVFGDVYEDMSHGWLVPLFSLYVLWTERRKLRDAVGEPSLWGLLASLPCILLALIGTRGNQVRFEQLGFIGLSLTVPWALFGRRLMKACIFPALFLLFTIPMNTYLAAFTVHLRLLACSVACFVSNGLGVVVEQHGAAIVSKSFGALDVEAGCSGLRSLFALMTLTAAYAWFTQPTWRRRGILFVCAIPLAVLGNVARILAICLMAAWGDPKFATGAFHDSFGYVVFVVAIALMVVCGETITRIAEPRTAKTRSLRPRAEASAALAPAADEESSAHGIQTSPPALWHRLLPWLAVVVLLPAFAFQTLAPQPELMAAPKIVLPSRLGDLYRGEEVFFCQNKDCAAMIPSSLVLQEERGGQVCPHCNGPLKGMSLAESLILPEDTEIVKRLYRSPYGERFLVSVVIGGASKSSLHRPELCMPAQGYLILDPRDLMVGERPFHALRLDQASAARAHLPSKLHVYTYFNQNGVHTASHLYRNLLDTWARSMLGRIDRWVMVTVTVESGEGVSLERPGDRRSLENFLLHLSKELP